MSAPIVQKTESNGWKRAAVTGPVWSRKVRMIGRYSPTPIGSDAEKERFLATVAKDIHAAGSLEYEAINRVGNQGGET